MATHIYLRSLRTRSALFAILFLCSSEYYTQNGISFYVGAGGNLPLPNYANAVELDNKGKGKPSNAFNLETKLKFSKHFSLSLNYLRCKNHLQVRFDEIQVSYFHRQSQTGGYVGSLTYVDDLYLYGNYLGLNLNYETRFAKNNLIFSLGANRGLFSSDKNKIDRYYESVPSNSTFSNVEARQSSTLTGPNLIALNASIRYERMIYNDKFGVFAQVNFMYNFISYSYEFAHSSLGWDDSYSYTYGNGSTSVNRYYTLSYHSLNCTAGIFYNISFRKNESR